MCYLRKLLVSVLTPPCKVWHSSQNRSFLLTVFSLHVVSYTTGHIWACPPSEGDDYIFHCHPPDQKIPKPKQLQEWFKKMLDKAVSERIVHDYKVSRSAGRGRSAHLLILLPCILPLNYPHETLFSLFHVTYKVNLIWQSFYFARIIIKVACIWQNIFKFLI